MGEFTWSNVLVIMILVVVVLIILLVMGNVLSLKDDSPPIAPLMDWNHLLIMR